MSPATIAILVASVSALFTGANMIVSLATYRRAKPKIEVKAELEALWEGPDEGSDVPTIGMLYVHLINRSATPVKLDRLFLVGESPIALLGGQRHPFSTLLPDDDVDDSDKTLEPFGGVKRSIPIGVFNYVDLHNTQRVRVVANLPDGRMVRSPWIKDLSDFQDPFLADMATKELRKIVESLGTADGGQLSFDDLPEPGEVSEEP
ncbi:hypothetical protein AB0K53_11970 [Streptomyces tuirus]|uniref:hypothetical protein n=1 Tax=Streptomyces tuirus TaxID=68278 RepID=UPI003439D53C